MNKNQLVERVAVIGLGLIGTSIALELKQKKCIEKIIGFDLSQKNLDDALSLQVFDEIYLELESKLLDVDLVIIATPISAVSVILEQMSFFSLNEKIIITDVASTKRSILQAYEKYLPKHYSYCVAAHPIAGSEKSGALHASISLFQDKKVILCQHSEQDMEAFKLVEKMWTLLGSHLFYMDVDNHDYIFAVTSHLPHIPAYAYLHQISSMEDKENILQFAGSGFRDFSRIAQSDAVMWADISIDNRDNLLILINHYMNQLAKIKDLLLLKNKKALVEYMQSSAQVREIWQKIQFIDDQEKTD